jgi:hypothetical protein
MGTLRYIPQRRSISYQPIPTPTPTEAEEVAVDYSRPSGPLTAEEVTFQRMAKRHPYLLQIVERFDLVSHETGNELRQGT